MPVRKGRRAAVRQLSLLPAPVCISTVAKRSALSGAAAVAAVESCLRPASM